MEQMSLEEAYAIKTKEKLNFNVIKNGYFSFFREKVESFMRAHGMPDNVQITDVMMSGDIQVDVTCRINTFHPRKSTNDLLVTVKSFLLMDEAGNLTCNSSADAREKGKKCFIEVYANSQMFYIGFDEDDASSQNLAIAYGIFAAGAESLMKDIFEIDWNEFFLCYARLYVASEILEKHEQRAQKTTEVEQRKKLVKIIDKNLPGIDINYGNFKRRILDFGKTRRHLYLSGNMEMEVRHLQSELEKNLCHLEKDGKRIEIA